MTPTGRKKHLKFFSSDFSKLSVIWGRNLWVRMVIWGLFLEMWFFKVWTQNVIFSIGGNLPKSGKSLRGISSSCSKISKSFFQKLLGSLCSCRLNLNICKKSRVAFWEYLSKFYFEKNFYFFFRRKEFLMEIPSIEQKINQFPWPQISPKKTNFFSIFKFGAIRERWMQVE